MIQQCTIFIDVDGVLNKTGQITSTDHIDYNLARIFSLIVKTTGADIVVSSTWRSSPVMYAKLKEVFAEHDILTNWVGEIADGNKADKIREYIYTNKITNFVIIDDCEDAVPEEMKEHLFQTTPTEGITVEIANRIIKYLEDKSR